MDFAMISSFFVIVLFVHVGIAVLNTFYNVFHSVEIKVFSAFSLMKKKGYG